MCRPVPQRHEGCHCVTGLAPGFCSTLMLKQGKFSQQTTPIAKGMRNCTLPQDARVDKWLSSIIKECDGMGVYIIHMKNLNKTGRQQTLYVYPPPSLHHTTTDYRPPPHQQMWLLMYGNATSLAALLGLLLGMDGVRKSMRPVQCLGWLPGIPLAMRLGKWHTQQMQKHGNEKCNSEKEKKGTDATDVTICCSSWCFMMVHAHIIALKITCCGWISACLPIVCVKSFSL